MGALADTSFITANDNITFDTADVALLNGSNLTVDTGAAGGNITIGTISGTSVETVTLDAGTGTLTVGAIGNSTEIGAVTLGSTDDGTVTLKGAITADAAVSITGPVLLSTNAISVSTTNDNITFNDTIDGGQTLTLVAGTGTTAIQGRDRW